MTQEQKELLLKDLCARLSYGVICADIHADEKFTNKWDIIAIDGTYGNEFSQVCISNCEETYGYKIPIERIKPYLFPLSSMTYIQKRELSNIFNCTICFTDYEIIIPDYNDSNMGNWQKIFEWCYKNHFDIYGLIPMGLAIDATGLNIY